MRGEGGGGDAFSVNGLILVVIIIHRDESIERGKFKARNKQVHVADGESKLTLCASDKHIWESKTVNSHLCLVESTRTRLSG